MIYFKRILKSLKAIKNIVINLVLFFYIISSFLSAMHTDHQALEEHNDCKVCIVIKNLHSSNNPNLEVNNIDYKYYHQFISTTKKIFLNKIVSKGFYSTAPPKLS